MGKKALGVVVLVAVLGWGVAAGQGGDDPSAGRACELFGQVWRDVRDGVATTAEVRSRMQEVERLAAGAPDVERAARAGLAAATQDDRAMWNRAAADMVAVC